MMRVTGRRFRRAAEAAPGWCRSRSPPGALRNDSATGSESARMFDGRLDALDALLGDADGIGPFVFDERAARKPVGEQPLDDGVELHLAVTQGAVLPVAALRFEVLEMDGIQPVLELLAGFQWVLAGPDKVAGVIAQADPGVVVLHGVPDLADLAV